MAVLLDETIPSRAPEVEAIDAATVLENLIELDRMLDEGTREALRDVHYLELSKHIRVKR